MTLDYKLNHENVVGVVFPCFSNMALCVENKFLLIEHNSGGLLCSEFACTCSYILNNCDFQTGDWGEPSITLRPPNEATASTPVQYWQHHPEKLIFQSCDYKAFVSVDKFSGLIWGIDILNLDFDRLLCFTFIYNIFSVTFRETGQFF